MDKRKSDERIESHKSRIHEGVTPPLPTELTAEWTVKAHLRFARAGESVRKTFSSCDPVNPVRIVYKWSTLESAGNLSSPDDPATTTEDVDLEERDDDGDDGDFDTSYHCRKTFSREPLKKSDIEVSSLSNKRLPTDSFRSIASSTGGGVGRGAEDSAFSGSNASNKKIPIISGARGRDGGKANTHQSIGTRCRSTCNIVVSAVADFLPSCEDFNQSELSEAGVEAYSIDNKLGQKGILDMDKVVNVHQIGDDIPIEKVPNTLKFHLKREEEKREGEVKGRCQH